MYIMALTILGLFPIKKNKVVNEIKVGDKFVCKKPNEYRGQVFYITKEMMEDEDDLEYFLHYNGFEKENV
jgi:hypothetical protein